MSYNSRSQSKVFVSLRSTKYTKCLSSESCEVVGFNLADHNRRYGAPAWPLHGLTTETENVSEDKQHFVNYKLYIFHDHHVAKLCFNKHVNYP
jgi:hypothetical protein